MGATGVVVVCAAIFAAVALCPAMAGAGDVNRARRDLAFAKDALQSERWDNVDSQMKRVTADLEGLSDAEKAPILAEVAELKGAASKGIEEDVTKRLDRAAKAESPESARGDLQRAASRLDSDEAKSYMDPAVMTKLRARIEAMKQGGTTPPATTTPPPTTTIPPPVTVNPAHADAIARAKRNLLFAKTSLERSPDGVEDQLKKVEADLQGLTDAENAPLAAEVAALRQQIAAAGKPGGTGTTPAPKPANPTASDLDRADAMARARRNLAFAKSALERDPANAESQLKRVENDLKILTDAEKAPLVAEVAALREQVMIAQNAENARPIEIYIKQKLEYCDKQVGDIDLFIFNIALNDAIEKLQSPEARKYLDSAKYKALKEQIEETRHRAIEGQKITIMSRTATGLKAAEAKLAENPFKGLRYTAEVDVNFGHWVRDIRERLRFLPADDADAKALEARIVAFEQRVASAKAAAAKEIADDDAAKLAAANAAEKQRLLQEAAERKAASIARMAGDWKSARDYINDWQRESPAPSPDAKKLQTNPVPRTALALESFRRWIGESAAMRAANPDDATLKAAMADAEKSMETAGAKASAAYNQILEAGERMSAPPSHYSDQAAPGQIASIAARTLEGTRYKEATVARARALQEKWDTAVAAAEKARKELYAQLSAEASAAWPAIEASVKVDEGFNPTEPLAWKGKTVKLKDIWNRAGWDFAPGYDFSLRVNGVPVAGNYDPKVLTAFNAGIERAKQPIDDHKNWDVIFVVEGQGTIKQRVKREIIIKETNEKFNTESWEPTPCVVVRIIALHAGPVAVGPN